MSHIASMITGVLDVVDAAVPSQAIWHVKTIAMQAVTRRIVRVLN